MSRTHHTPPREGTVRLTVVMRPETYQALQARAEADERSLSATADRVLHNALVGKEGGAR